MRFFKQLVLSKLSFIMYRLARKKREMENDYNPTWLDMISNCLANMAVNDVTIMQGNSFTTKYVNIAVERRLKDSICPICRDDSIGDEFHYSF